MGETAFGRHLLKQAYEDVLTGQPHPELWKVAVCLSPKKYAIPN